METSSSASSAPGQVVLPAEKGRKAPALGIKSWKHLKEKQNCIVIKMPC